MRSKRSMNFLIREACGLTAAVVAVGTLSVSAPALAAPNDEVPGVSISEIVLAGANKESGNRGQGKNLHDRSQKLEQGDSRAKRGAGDRDGDDRNRSREEGEDGEGGNRDWSREEGEDGDGGNRDWSREEGGDRDGGNRDWSREEGEDGDGYWRRGNRGNHYGWERGKHLGWNKDPGHPRYGGDREDRRAERRESGWTGQRIIT